MGGENSPNSIFIEVKAKGQVDLLGNAGTAETGVTFLHLDDGIDHFLDGPFGPGLRPHGRIKQSVLSFLERSMKS